MSGWHGHTKLNQLLAGLKEAGLIPQLAGPLQRSAETVEAALRSSILEEIPAFRVTGNPDVLPGLALHVRAHIAEILRLFEGQETGGFEFVLDHARIRAAQRFPLEVTLHAYRCGHREVSRWLRDAALGLNPPRVEQAVALIADFAIEYTDTVSQIAAAEYVARTRLIAEAESDQRSELLSILLTGYDESDGRVAQLLRRAGYLAQRQAYCVLVAQPVNAAEMDHPERGRRIIEAIAQALDGTPIRVLAAVRNNLVTAVLSGLRRQSGWTEARGDLAERVVPLLQGLGTSVVAGISTDHPSTAYLPKALGEATIALDFADVTNRIVAFGTLPLRSILVHHGSAAVRAATPRWVAALLEADAEAAGALADTLRAFAQSGMNMQKAARQLGKHPNTLYARFERIRSVTGYDGTAYHDLTELLLALDCWRK